MILRDLTNETMAIMTLADETSHEARAFLAVNLKRDHFHDPRTAEIHRLIMAMAKRRKNLPSWKTLKAASQLSSEARELLDEDSYPPVKTEGDAEQILSVLEKLRQGRIIISMFNDTMEKMEPEDAEPQEAFAIIEKGLLDARAFSADDALRIGPNGNLEKALEDLLARRTPNTIPTGFRDFDDEAGGLPRGGLTTIAANSGGGKSCMALQICVNGFWEGYSSAIVTLEMNKDQMLGRLEANTANVNYRDINLQGNKIRGQIHLLSDMQMSKMRKAKDKMMKHTEATNTRLDIFPMTDTTISEIALQLRAFEYDIIVIDYINLLNKDDSDQKNEAQALGEIARIAKVQAASTNAAWIILAQLNEQGLVKYSRAIKEHSDYMLTWSYGDAEKESHVIEIDQQKSRNSEAFKFNLKENFKLQQFSNSGGGEGENRDVVIEKGKKKKRERLATATPMPGMSFDEEDEDDDL